MNLPRRSMRLKDTFLSNTSQRLPEAQDDSVLLAKGRRGGRIWYVWQATSGIRDDLQSIETSHVLPEEYMLYIDNEGYIATHYKSKLLHWLPFVVAPRYKTNDDSLLDIGEGRPTIRRKDQTWSHTRMPAVADRMQRRGEDKMWYLVTWKLPTIRNGQGLPKEGTKLRILKNFVYNNGDLIGQFAPSWIRIDDFKPCELSLLRCFYQRKGRRALSVDESRCTLVNALNLSHSE
jgi:hypothetical protein